MDIIYYYIYFYIKTYTMGDCAGDAFLDSEACKSSITLCSSKSDS